MRKRRVKRAKCYGCGHVHGPRIGAKDCPRCKCLGFIRSERDAPAVLVAALLANGCRVSSRLPVRRPPRRRAR